MTNSEGNIPTQSDVPADAPEVDAPVLPVAHVTEVTNDGVFAQPDQAFRYLNWFYSIPAEVAGNHVDLSGFSAERQQGIDDLVRNGLIREVRYEGGVEDGRRSMTLTLLGVQRLQAAREAAASIVVGFPAV